MWHLMHHIMNPLLLEIRIHLLQTFIYFFNCLSLQFSFPFCFFVAVLFLAIGIYLLQFYLPLTTLRTKYFISFRPIRRQHMQREQIHMEQLQRRGSVAFFFFFLKSLLLNYWHY
ncbi:hypothetical protein AMTRI_Chr06g172800 [Amborella trichopoda]